MSCFWFFWSKRRTRKEPDVINITGACSFTEVKVLTVKPAAEGSLPAVATKSVKELKATLSAVPEISVLEVKAITDNFGKKALLGAGSYGKVYLGRLQTTGQLAAFKKLDDCKQPAHEFLSQVSLVAKLEHKNVLGLIGYSIDGDDRVLAYEYASAGSLYDALHGSTKGSQHRPPLLSWTQRVKIALGAAEGLKYLHEEGIIHCNIKPTNILLLYDVAKIADFDLAHQEAARLNTSGDLGSFGYQDPAFAMNGQLTSESDVYSFGVILVELLTGRKPIDRSLPQGERSLVIWATTKFSDGMAYECVDPRLGTNYSEKGVTKIAAVAALCLQYDASSRPNMSTVVMNLLRIT